MGQMQKMWNQKRKGLLVAAVLLIAVSWWRVFAAGNGLISRNLESDGVPMRFMVAEDRDNAPGVIIAHGFGASSQIMLGYGYALAHAGYGVMLLDFDGHAANSAPFDWDDDRLGRNLDAAYAALVAQPEIDGQNVALLGHSMGGGAVMRAGIDHPERYRATVAVSASGADVTPELPSNLLLMPGEWEGRLIERSDEMLAQAGGASNDFDNGRARALVIVPRAEHILVLFSPFAHQTAIEWLNQSFGVDLHTSYRDARMIWFGLGLTGWMLLAVVLAPFVRISGNAEPEVIGRWRWIGVALMPFVASGLVALVDSLWSVSNLGGILVGGALSLWFLIMGLGWLLIGCRPSAPDRRQVVVGLVLFAFLWISVGLMSQVVWLRWYLVPARFLRWPLMALAFFPWLLAAGHVQYRGTVPKRAGWWLLQSVLIIGGQLLLVTLVPSLFVIILALPVLPLLLALMSIAGAAVDNPWSYAIGNALFFGWQIAAYFPFTGGV